MTGPDGTERTGRAMAWACAAAMALTLVAAATVGAGQGQQESDQPADKARQSDHDERGRRDEDRDRGWRRQIDADDLTDEMIDAVMRVVSAANPHHARKLEELRERDAVEFRDAIARIASTGRMRWLLGLSRYDPEGFELHLDHIRTDTAVDGLRRELAEAFEKQRQGQDISEQRIAALRADLRDAIRAELEAELAIGEHELRRFEERIGDIKRRLEERRARLEEDLDERHEEAVSEAREGRGEREDRYRRRGGRGGPPGPPGFPPDDD